MLALGIANATSKDAHKARTKRRDSFPQIRIPDLLVFTALAGITIAISMARVKHDSSTLRWCGLALPWCFALYLHWRHQLSPIVATAIHYGVSLMWGFFAGFAFYQHFNHIYRNDPSRFQFDPVRQGMQWLTEMAGWGITSSSVYFAVTTVFIVVWQRQANRYECEDGEQSNATDPTGESDLKSTFTAPAR